ncbi:MAG: hypothetical protein ABIZ05_09305 [Pseudonocardiaceae bacterium]
MEMDAPVPAGIPAATGGVAPRARLGRPAVPGVIGRRCGPPGTVTLGMVGGLDGARHHAALAAGG